MKEPKPSKKRAGPQSLLDNFSTDAPHVTEMRRLLQTLLRGSRGSDARVYMLTSAARGEGKSTASALMAIVAARVFHRRTLLIDGDMRRPCQHLLLDVARRPGLYEYVHGRATLEAITRPTPISTLHVIASGSPGRATADSYDDDGFARLIKAVRPLYELIILDVAPVVPVVESTMMAEHVDGVLLVTMAGQSAIPLIRRMRDILTPVRDKIVGGIVNNATEGLPYYYDYKYYGYQPDRARKSNNAEQPQAESDLPASESGGGHEPSKER